MDYCCDYCGKHFLKRRHLYYHNLYCAVKLPGEVGVPRVDGSTPSPVPANTGDVAGAPSSGRTNASPAREPPGGRDWRSSVVATAGTCRYCFKKSISLDELSDHVKSCGTYEGCQRPFVNQLDKDNHLKGNICHKCL